MPNLESRIKKQRLKLANRIHAIAEMEKEAQPPVVQELVLARRAAEDSRMRLGVALGYLRGQDPFRDREVEIKEEESSGESPDDTDYSKINMRSLADGRFKVMYPEGVEYFDTQLEAESFMSTLTDDNESNEGKEA